MVIFTTCCSGRLFGPHEVFAFQIQRLRCCTKPLARQPYSNSNCICICICIRLCQLQLGFLFFGRSVTQIPDASRLQTCTARADRNIRSTVDRSTRAKPGVHIEAFGLCRKGGRPRFRSRATPVAVYFQHWHRRTVLERMRGSGVRCSGISVQISGDCARLIQSVTVRR